MPPPKEKTITRTPSNREIESRELSLVSDTLEEQAKKQLSPDLLRKIKKIIYYTSESGLHLQEACLLSDIDFEAFTELLQTNNLVSKIIHMKELQYKKDLLHTISQRARDGDDKLALWLLERKYPGEFIIDKRGTTGPQASDEEQMFVEAIEWVQKTGDANPLVRETAGKAIIIKKKSGGESNTIKEITEMLA